MELKKIKKLIAIVGPTASGKTGLAVFLAKKLNGEIVSADSRQVYRGLDIGTGKDLAEYGNVKYHLIDICEPEENFTMFDWLDRARIVIEDIFSRGKLPIIVGGTGLYVQALIEGFALEKSEIRNPKSETNLNSQIQKYRREELNEMPLSELQKIARKYLSQKTYKLQPNRYNLDLNNPRRLIRFIERAQSGEQMTKVKPDFKVLQIGIDLPREELYKKIDKRVDDRFDQGMLEEVAGLIAAGVDPAWLIKLGLEYRIITEYIQKISNSKLLISNEISNDKMPNEATSYQLFPEMQQHLKYAIHAYARRQLTWFHRFPQIKWVKNKEKALKLAKDFVV